MESGISFFFFFKQGNDKHKIQNSGYLWDEV